MAESQACGPLMLASTSPYRAELLSRLGLPFETYDSCFDECADASLPPEELVRINTLGKAESLRTRLPHARIIASDQIAVCEDRILGKPGSFERAVEQLRFLAGREACFMTGVCLVDSEASHYAMVPCRIRFRRLTSDEIRRYVEIDRPLDCAGSFKSESLGIALFERFDCPDPTALIGLPLMQLCEWLRPLSPR